MTVRLIFAGGAFNGMKRQLLAASPREAMSIILARRGGEGRLLVDQIIHPPEDAYGVQTETRIVLKPEFLAKPIKAARDADLCVMLCHTHPYSSWPYFSPVDDEGERAIIPSIFARALNGPHGSLVIGEEGFAGRVYAEPAQPFALDEVIDVSTTVETLSIHDRNTQLDDLFDRNVRAIGAQGQALLLSLKVGVVGLGGTGSVVAQQLAYLGVGNLLLLDDDRLESTNLNRVVGAGLGDVGHAKVDVAAAALGRSGPGRSTVFPIRGSVLDASSASQLLSCDFIFCCTDNAGSRMIINQLAYQYLLPVIDMGIRIDASEGRIKAMAGRVQMLAPTLSCLQCHGFLDPEMVRRDLMNDVDRAADRYIVGEAEPQPAVVSLNSTVSSLAVTMFLAVVAGFPMRVRHQNYIVSEGTVRGVATPPLHNCIVCSSSRGALAKGDSWPMPWRSR